MKQLAYLLIFLSSCTMSAQQTLDELLALYNTRSIPYISVEESRMLQLKGDIVILDTREQHEYDVSHLKGAQFVGYNTFSAEEVSEKIKNKNTPLLVYCSLGIRSEEIGEQLEKAGYTNVRNIYGGIFEWKNNEFPVVNMSEHATDSIHTFSKAWSKWLTKGIKVTSPNE